MNKQLSIFVLGLVISVLLMGSAMAASAGQIVVTKNVVGGSLPASSFTISATGSCIATSFPGNAAGTTLTCTSTGNKNFNISEVPPAHYTVGLSGDCSGSIGNGDVKYCTVTNTYVPYCGDGLINGAETCDDNNNVLGDGCSDVCAIEPGYECFGEPSVCSVAVPEYGLIAGIVAVVGLLGGIMVLRKL